MKAIDRGSKMRESEKVRRWGEITRIIRVLRESHGGLDIDEREIK